MTSKTTWQNLERRVAEFFGSFRVPLSGSASRHNTHSDSLHPDLYIECKLRTKGFTSIFNWYNQARENAVNERKIPLIAVRQKGSSETLILCKLEDLLIIAKEAQNAQQTVYSTQTDPMSVETTKE